MSSRTQWIARAWLAYLLMGVTGLTLGAVLGQAGRGLTFIGLVCLCFGVYGAGRRVWLDVSPRHCG